MADGTHIEWCDATWNPITGCSVVSPGCTNCYAMKLAGTRLKHIPSRKGLTRDTKAGPVWTGEVRLNEEWLDQPLRWKRPRKIFVCAHGDLFAENVPDEWIDRVFAVMALAPHHTFQVLTKRADRMRRYLADCGAILGRQGEVRAAIVDIVGGRDRPGVTEAWLRVSGSTERGSWKPLPNVWLGVSAEDQVRADERIPDLLATPAAVRWVSAEPLLSPIDFYRTSASMPVERHPWRNGPILQGIDWIVAGGESGRGARPMHPAWARSIRDQCAAAGVPFLFKQWGRFAPAREFALVEGDRPITVLPDGRVREWDPDFPAARLVDPEMAAMLDVGKKAAGRLLDGVEHSGFPS